MAHSHDHSRHHHHHSSNILVKFGQALHLPGFIHDHSHADLAGDRAFLDNRLAVRTVWIALIALGLTTVLQIVIYVASGSVALLADTVHNLGDALNSIPLSSSRSSRSAIPSAASAMPMCSSSPTWTRPISSTSALAPDGG